MYQLLPLLFITAFCATAFELFGVKADFSRHANPAANSHPVAVDMPTVIKEEKGNRTRNWLLNQALPVVAQTFSRCNIKPVTWANQSLGRLTVLDQLQVTRWLDMRSTHHTTDSRNRRSLVKNSNLECYFLFVYSTKCPFSVAAFPFVKALARAFPQLNILAVQVEDYVVHRWSLRMLYVPKLKFMAAGRILREYTGSDTDLDGMIDFVWSSAHQLPKGPVGLQPHDFQGNPIMPDSKDTQFLAISWLTVLCSMIYLCCVFGPTILAQFSLYRLTYGFFGKTPEESPPGTVLTWNPL